MKKIIFLIVYLLGQNFVFCQYNFFSNQVRQKYHSIARKELEINYRLAKENKLIDSTRNLPRYFKSKNLKTYSVPVFELSKNKDLAFEQRILFKEDPYRQEVWIKHRDTLVSFFKLNKKDKDKTFFDDFDKVERSLYYYRFNYSDKSDFPIYTGGVSPNFFPTENFEESYFVFRIKGFPGLFYYKDKELFYVMKMLYHTKIIKVDDNFPEKIPKI